MISGQSFWSRVALQNKTRLDHLLFSLAELDGFVYSLYGTEIGNNNIVNLFLAINKW